MFYKIFIQVEAVKVKKVTRTCLNIAMIKLVWMEIGVKVFLSVMLK